MCTILFLFYYENCGFLFFMIYFGVKFLFTPWNLISDLDFYAVISNFINLYVDCYYYAITNCKSCRNMQKNDKILSSQFKIFFFILPFSPLLFAFLFLLLLSKLNLLGERKCVCLPRICNKTAFVWHIGVKKVSNIFFISSFM